MDQIQATGYASLTHIDKGQETYENVFGENSQW